MRIAVIAHIRHAIAQPFNGGMEAHCAALCRGLADHGHRVTLFAAPGSDCADDIHPICEAPYEQVLPWAQWHGTATLDAFLHTAYTRAWHAIRGGEFEVVHNNTLLPALIGWGLRDNVPMLTSQHVPPFARMHEAVAGAAGELRAQISVTSNSQVHLWCDAKPANFHVVHNGIDTHAWRPAVRGERLLWSGRITPNKGTGDALRAAHLAGCALDVAGVIEDETYFAQAVAPLLDDRRRYLGHLSGPALRTAVARAAAVVVTPLWAEPFGLVAAEALSCDVPVIAYANGAMAEVVGNAGVLVPPGDINGLARAMAAPPNLAPGAARARALDAFSIPAMIAGYERLYAAAIGACAPAMVG